MSLLQKILSKITCASIVVTTTSSLIKAYYLLTAYVPRRLPTDEVEFEELKEILLQNFGLKDNDGTWATVAGQITSTPATSLRKSYGNMANAAKRLQINYVAQTYKEFAFREINRKMKEQEEKNKDGGSSQQIVS